MASDFLPTSDEGLVIFAQNFSNCITAGFASYGLTSTQATAYEAVFAAYQAAFNAAQDPMTRTGPAIESKNARRAELRAITRAYAKIVNAAPGTNNTKRRELRLTVPKPRHRVSPPTVRPGTRASGVDGRTLTLEVFDAASIHKRGFPDGCSAAWVYSYAGAVYPSDPGEWEFCGATTRGKMQITFPDSVPAGSTVWVCAAFINARQEAGPVSMPVSGIVQYTGSTTVMPISVARDAA